MAGELVERLRAVQHGTDRPYAASVAADAIDRIEALERENATLRAERDEARKRAFEQVATYHDDLASQHAACEYESSHHDLMVKLHQQFAAAIRNMGGGENG
jgi:hypothetical protein